MYTGIVTHVGEVVAFEQADADSTCHIVVAVTPPLPGAPIGASVSIQGTCLTVTAFEERTDGAGMLYHFDVVPETLRMTTLGGLCVGAPVNVEGSLRVGDEIGGHWVQGHVDGTGAIVEIQKSGGMSDDVRLTIEVPEALAEGLLPKGSITIDGVSLTVGEVFDRGGGGRCFNVYLIPHTLAVTTLGRAEIGDAVNLERDVMGRWVAHHVERYLSARDA